MLFNSFLFLLFFPAVTLIYFLLPHKWRWLHLLAASCLFYCAFVPVYILILFFTILIDYIAALYIEPAEGTRRKRYLVLSIVANVGVLAVFKYYNFFLDNFNDLITLLGVPVRPLPLLNILLPIGLSFHTFQAMSYTIEVYRGNQKAERHLGIYALYVMFYPQLVAGPIERPQNILHQFRERHYFNNADISAGLRLMLWGFFMKVVVADRLAQYVNAAYGNVGEHNGTTLLLATFLFAFQIYGDFAGYSYIAVGAARCMGFRLMTNFNRPYLASSVATFWKRWHISLSTWFRDYVYIPLGGNRAGKSRHLINLMLVFLLSGFWHGANWTFVVWGGLNGLYLIAESRLSRKSPVAGHKHGFRHYAGVLLTFLLISFSWIFFRAGSIEQAFAIIRKIATQTGGLPFLSWGTLVYAAIGLGVLIVTDRSRERRHGHWFLAEHPRLWVRLAWSICLLVMILLFGVFDGGQFIYFQF